MKKTNNQIITEIKSLLDELVFTSDTNIGTPKKVSTIKQEEYSGCSGGIRHLVEQGYFNEPRNKQEIVDKLKEAGRYYSSQLVSMNLLNLSGNTEKLLTKLGQRGSYKFVIRK